MHRSSRLFCPTPPPGSAIKIVPCTDNTTGISFFHWPANLVKTRYVMLAKADADYLSLAEVEVLGF